MEKEYVELIKEISELLSMAIEYGENGFDISEVYGKAFDIYNKHS